MSFAVRLYTLSKRDNSTKKPSGNGTTFDCVMRDGCGIVNPTISLDLGLTNDPSQFNYCYIPNFERYYFIDEWFFQDRLWTANCKVDVLATYKSEIGNANLYVMRASNESDGTVTDLLYPSKTGCSFNTVSKTNPWDSESFVVGIVSRLGAFGSLSYYQMSQGQLGVLCYNMTDAEHIITTLNGFNLDDASEALQLSLVDPIQYIKSCIMLPSTEISNTSVVANIPVYNWDSNASGNKIIPSSRITKSYDFDIKKHPDTNSRGNYVNSAPFTNITLTIPPFGCIDIDTSVTCNASSLNVSVEVDPVSGKGVLVVKCNGIILNRLESQIGVPISLSSVTRDYVGAATAAAGGVGNAINSAMQGNIGGLISGTANAIGDATQALQPRSQTVGTTGAFVSNRGAFRLDFQFFRPIEDDNAHNGRPLCKKRTLGTLGGYMKIQDGDVTINGTATEDKMIRDYLEGGFYYE